MVYIGSGTIRSFRHLLGPLGHFPTDKCGLLYKFQSETLLLNVLNDLCGIRRNFVPICAEYYRRRAA